MKYPEIKALQETTEKLIILVHGFGSNGDDLISLVPYVQHQLPHCHFISPHGVDDFELAPTLGRQWFSLQNREPKILSALIATAVPKLEEIIKEKQKELNLTNKDTILIGFSQGSMMSLYLNLIATEPFAGVVGFSGALIPPPVVINITTPICLVHGTADEVLGIEYFYNAQKYLSEHNIKYEAHEIPNLMHTIDATGINFCCEFIKAL